MIEMVCVKCGVELIFPEWIGLGELQEALEEHGCQPQRVRWDGAIVAATAQ